MALNNAEIESKVIAGNGTGYLWIALADRVPEDVDVMVKRHPKDMPELMRLVIGCTPGEFKALKEAVRNIRKLNVA